jgi:uncharacterized protein (TIGR00645 family)
MTQNSPGPRNTAIERVVERTLFLSRWLMAPMYLGLAAGMFLLMYAFAVEFLHMVHQINELTPSGIILGMLSLIDVSLAANLVLIVIFSGYENFVSRMEVVSQEDRPKWQGSVDFTGLKLKLIASIVAISAIHLLKVFMDIQEFEPEHVRYMIVIHVTFVISGVLLAFMDRLTADSH